MKTGRMQTIARGPQHHARGWCVRRAVAVTMLVAAANCTAQLAIQPSGSPAPEIRDIAPPLDVFPYPLWMVVSAAAAGLLLIGIAAWLLFKWLRKKPVLPPPMPRDAALSSLREAQSQLDQLDPYAFSILVSDILRRYVSAQYGLRATQQTSPEFLARVTDSPRFADDERVLLAGFLEKCDLIKFAHIDATRDDSAALLDQAMRFVSGARWNTSRSGITAAPIETVTAGGAR